MMIKRIKIPIYELDLTIIQVHDQSEIPEEFRDSEIKPGFEAYSIEIDNEHGYRHYGMIFGPKPDLGVLCHESFHVMMYMTEHLGIIPLVSNMEPHAYLQEYIFNQCFKYLNFKNYEID